MIDDLSRHAEGLFADDQAAREAIAQELTVSSTVRLRGALMTAVSSCKQRSAESRWVCNRGGLVS